MDINYENFLFSMIGIALVVLVFLFSYSFYYIVFWTVSGKKIKKVPHSDKLSKFGILIAARNESKVIRNIFQSLKEQTYPKEYFDVWVIVEDENDPTVQIAKEFGYNYFVRDELVDGRRTKGFALQECIRHFDKNNIVYDAYMIFDADNVMDTNYIEVMNDLRQHGVKVGLGSRAFTNADKNWLTAGSAIMFAYMNQITSRARSALFHKATLMGTGYFVDKSIIDEAGGWQFTGMTEDIQLTSYCYYRDVYMKFYPIVKIYDEQADTYKTCHKQHMRWLSGFFSRRKFLKKLGTQQDYHTKGMQSFMRFEFRAGVAPFVIFQVMNILIMILCLVFGSLAVFFAPNKLVMGSIFGVAGFCFGVNYLSFLFAAWMVIYRHNDELKLSKKNQVIAVLTYMFYFYDFGLAFIDYMIHPQKGVTWSTIEHKGELINEDSKKVS